jgi:CHAT domain-containing protein
MDQVPRSDVFRDLVINAFEPDEMRRFCADHPPFNDLNHRFGPSDGILDMADEVWKYVKMFWLWDEFFVAVARYNPRVFNRFATDLGRPTVEAPVTQDRAEQMKQQPSVSKAAPQVPAVSIQLPYVDFVVHVTSGEGGRYLAYASSNLVGESSGLLQLPWTDSTVRDMAKQLENQETEREDLVEIGSQLFQALFQGDVRDSYRGAVAQIKDGSRLRLRLQFDPPELRALPWELLYDTTQDEFLALSGKVLITRYVATAKPALPLTVALPLVVLVVAASPVDVSPELDVEAEVAAVQTALSPLEKQGLVRIVTISHAEMWSLRNALRDHDPEVLHLVMHGDVGPQGGELMLEGSDGRVEPLPASKLCLLLKRTRVRLAVVNACLSGRDEAVEPGPLQNRRQAVMGVGPTLLIRAGLGAVVANQFSVDDEAAQLFAKDFYATLARFEPLDEAVSRAREALVLEYDEGAREWATPVLFLRAPDGILFSPSKNQAPVSTPTVSGADPEPVIPLDLEAMRQQLNRRFDDPGLDGFCLDHFGQVYDRFSRGMRKDEKITLLIDHCRRAPDEWARLQQALAR